MRVLRASLLVAASTLSLLWIGCKDSTKPTHTLNGHWVTNFTAASGATTIDITLAQTGSSISGSGTIGNQYGTDPVNVTGTHVHPSVSLTIAIVGYDPAVITGTCNDAGTSISGAINGSGFVNRALTLLLQ